MGNRIIIGLINIANCESRTTKDPIYLLHNAKFSRFVIRQILVKWLERRFSLKGCWGTSADWLTDGRFGLYYVKHSVIEFRASAYVRA